MPATSSLSNTSSKRQLPSGMAAMAGAHLALGVVQQRGAGASTVSVPYLAHSAWKRCTPTRFAAIWARKSDSRSGGTWQFSRTRSIRSRLQLAPR